MSGVHREAAPLRTLVVKLLRDAIVAADFAPGERLVERTLCERFDVSRTVIREAIRQLESEGLIEMVANRGPIVARLTTSDAASLYEVREVLEALAGRAFAQRATSTQKATLKRRLKDVEAALDGGSLATVLATKDAFYDALLEGSDNAIAWTMLRAVHARSSLLRGLTLQAPGRSVNTRRELRAITAAATSGDADAAWQACAEHVRSAAKVAMQLLNDAEGDAQTG